MTAAEWFEYLRSYSDDYLRTADEYELEALTEEQREQRWLGFAPATEAQVAAAEQRLGHRLPASYRNFLLTSNGWSQLAPWIHLALPVEEIGWFHEIDEITYSAWTGHGLDDVDAMLGRALTIAQGHDGDRLLLDPGEVGEDGEWVAYSWHPGGGDLPQPAPGFAALVAQRRQLFEELRGRHGRPVHAEGAEELLEEGRRHTLAGDVKAARASLAEAYNRGSALAPYLDALLAGFFRPAQAESKFRNQVIFSERVLRAVNEEHLWAELVPLYSRVTDGNHRGLARLADNLAKWLPELGLPGAVPGPQPVEAFHEAVRIAAQQPPFLAEPPEFQEALDAARRQTAEGDDEGAWATIAEALPAWSTDSPFRIAPVVLLVDPALSSVVTPDRFSTIVTARHEGPTGAAFPRNTVRGVPGRRAAKTTPGRPKRPAVRAVAKLPAPSENPIEDPTDPV